MYVFNHHNACMYLRALFQPDEAPVPLSRESTVHIGSLRPEIVDDETAAGDDLVAIADIQADPNPFNKLVQHFSVQVSDTH